jgi:D-amino peptidase
MRFVSARALAFRFTLALAFAFAASVPAPAPGQDTLKVFISADMEGVVGSVTGEQLGPAGFEYQRFREFMTEEVLAAIRGARAAGATEFVVADSHGNGQNLLIDRFPKDVQIVRSWPRPLGMMEGLDGSFDAAMFIGYHTSTSNPQGVRAHTFSSATLTDVRLNGISVAEAGFNAAIAGHLGVPIVLVSGDDAIVEETRRYVGDVEGAVVKWAKSFHSARTLTPAAAYEVIEATAKRAIERLDDFQPFRLEGDITLDVSFKHYRQAEILSYLPIVERTDAHSIRFVGRDMVEVSRFAQFMNNYQPGLSP